MIAIGGTRWVSADTKDQVWVNPNTGSRKLCAPEDLTELISIDPETLAVVERNVVRDINISAVTEEHGRIYGVGTSHLNCRLETDVKIVEISSSLGLSLKFESQNVNSVTIHDIKALENGVLVLGGEVSVFLPNTLANKIPSRADLDNSLVSNVWAESFWESGERHSAALLMAITVDGQLLADRVFPDQRGRGFSSLLVRAPDEVLGVGRAFGDRGWAALMRLGEPITKFEEH